MFCLATKWSTQTRFCRTLHHIVPGYVGRPSNVKYIREHAKAKFDGANYNCGIRFWNQLLCSDVITVTVSVPQRDSLRRRCCECQDQRVCGWLRGDMNSSCHLQRVCTHALCTHSSSNNSSCNICQATTTISVDTTPANLQQQHWSISNNICQSTTATPVTHNP